MVAIRGAVSTSKCEGMMRYLPLSGSYESSDMIIIHFQHHCMQLCLNINYDEYDI